MSTDQKDNNRSELKSGSLPSEDLGTFPFSVEAGTLRSTPRRPPSLLPFRGSRDSSPQQSPCSHPWRILSSSSPQPQPQDPIRPSADSSVPIVESPQSSHSRRISLPGEPMTLSLRNAKSPSENGLKDPQRMRPNRDVEGSRFTSSSSRCSTRSR